ncbi:MAG: VCBS repeat-containing protein, partial [Myxococcales bacterium]
LRAGHGDGTFGAITTVSSTPNEEMEALAVGDLDGDGHLDVAASLDGFNGKYSIHVSLGHGDGTFEPAKILDTKGQIPSDLAIADVDGDGKADLLASNARQKDLPSGMLVAASTVSLFRGQGGGKFAAPTMTGVGAGPRALVVGDMNGDGKPDLVTLSTSVNFQLNAVTVALGSGTGTFPNTTTLESTFPMTFLGVQDVNGDGRPDIVGVGGTTFNVWLAGADGAFAPALQAPAEGDAGGHRARLADIDHDGHVDLLYPGDGVAWHRGHGDGTFGPVRQFGMASQDIGVADVDGDGHLDVLGDSIALMRGVGDGTFHASRITADAFGGQGHPGSYNGDSRSDLLDIRPQGLPARACIRLAQTDGFLGPGTCESFWSVQATDLVTAGDINGDGLLDAVGFAASGPRLQFLFGQAGGTFAPLKQQVLTVPPSSLVSKGLALLDANGDGTLDAALFVDNRIVLS